MSVAVILLSSAVLLVEGETGTVVLLVFSAFIGVLLTIESRVETTNWISGLVAGLVIVGLVLGLGLVLGGVVVVGVGGGGGAIIVFILTFLELKLLKRLIQKTDQEQSM